MTLSLHPERNHYEAAQVIFYLLLIRLLVYRECYIVDEMVFLPQSKYEIHDKIFFVCKEILAIFLTVRTPLQGILDL